jgi:hypothetical protein
VTLQDALGRFLALAEQVEGEEDDGIHGVARECLHRRRDDLADGLGFRSEKKIEEEKKKWGARVRPRVFIGSRNAPRHAAAQGEIDSSEEEVATASCCRARVRGRRRSSSSVLSPRRGMMGWAKLASAKGGVVMGCAVGLSCGAARPAR